MKVVQIVLLWILGFRSHGLLKLQEFFWPFPMQRTDMAVGKRKVRSLTMSIGGKIPPLREIGHIIGSPGTRIQLVKSSAGDGLFVLINENKGLARGRVDNLGPLLFLERLNLRRDISGA
jgi:hypothetical protein